MTHRGRGASKKIGNIPRNVKQKSKKEIDHMEDLLTEIRKELSEKLERRFWTEKEEEE